MTEVPHQFVRVQVRGEGGSATGLASEGLPPKWFTKDPATSFEEDLEDMLRVIRHATELATAIAQRPVTFFQFWRELSRQQAAWAQAERLPSLLAHLGISLCERAVLDGLCRSLNHPLHRLILENRLGLDLGEIHPELGNAEPRDLLPATPLSRLHVRHTVGLSDPLTPQDIRAADKVSDGLPQDLQTSVQSYGLTYFKIKLSGNLTPDRDRLKALDTLLSEHANGNWHATLDGNENFQDFAAFREYWEMLTGDKALRQFCKHILVVEQPVHRDLALSESARAVLQAWPSRPALIIDESDGAPEDLPRALSLGYAGASHKNCKGIVKGLANACLLAHRHRQGQPGILTGEDLCNLGPVARLQDLAMMALLGIQHVERNGHHYYRGLSMWPKKWQETVLAAHGDLYVRHPDGFVCVRINAGQIEVESVNSSPFGLQPLLDPTVLGNEH